MGRTDEAGPVKLENVSEKGKGWWMRRQRLQRLQRPRCKVLFWMIFSLTEVYQLLVALGVRRSETFAFILVHISSLYSRTCEH
jgi:hypothetical protein